MKYGIRERLFWRVLKSGFEREMENTLCISDGSQIMKKARRKYREMLVSARDPHNRFAMNIIFASMVGAIYLSLNEKPSVEQMIPYVRESVMKNKFFLKFVVSEKNYTPKGQKALAESAKKSESDNNPYSWRYTFKPGKNILEYTTFFTSCGICYLFEQWGISEITPSMCRLDYDMAHANNTEFIREQTLFEGGKYCDCHYIHTPPNKKE